MEHQASDSEKSSSVLRSERVASEAIAARRAKSRKQHARV